MPDPIVIPTTSATELQSPSVRGSRSVVVVVVCMAPILNTSAPKRSEYMTSEVNVAGAERWASALGGAALTAYAIKQLKDRSPAGAALAAAGTALIYRGATGHCAMYAAAGINTANGENDTRRALGGSRGVQVEEAFTINKPPEELFAFWRRFEQLPSFMDHL